MVGFRLGDCAFTLFVAPLFCNWLLRWVMGVFVWRRLVEVFACFLHVGWLGGWVWRCVGFDCLLVLRDVVGLIGWVCLVCDLTFLV